jgi:hypothetical protein
MSTDLEPEQETSLQYLQYIFNPVGEQKFSRAEFVKVLMENAWNRDKAYEALTKNEFLKFQEEKHEVKTDPLRN